MKPKCSICSSVNPRFVHRCSRWAGERISMASSAVSVLWMSWGLARWGWSASGAGTVLAASVYSRPGVPTSRAAQISR